MNHNIQKLYKIANKPEKIILGLMSGTSLDGLDLALCKFTGNGINTKVELLHFATKEYSIEFKTELREVFGKTKINLEKLCLLNAYIGNYYSKIINETLKFWSVKNDIIDLIASHGQTVYHSPKNKHQQAKFDNATLQIGDADHIAVNTNIITISDFRQKHIAAGGQGAPLAIYGDYFLLSSNEENRVLLNIGGIANFTFLPSSMNMNEIICTDTGPGNTLMDAYLQHHHSNLQYDENADIAKQGKICNELFNALIQHNFFKTDFPKTTGQEVFNLAFIKNALVASNTEKLSIYDVLATLNYFTAFTIIDAINKTVGNKIYTVYISGGGCYNPILLEHIKTLLPNIDIKKTSSLGVDADAKEAILFALLANECVCGNSDFYTTNTKKILPITMGKISFPN